MNSSRLNESSNNLSKSFGKKSNFNKNEYFSDTKDIFLNNNYSLLADEQKHYINDLLKKLQSAKDERKRAEKNNKIVEYRLNLLHSQEKVVINLFKKYFLDHGKSSINKRQN